MHVYVAAHNIQQEASLKLDLYDKSILQIH